MKATRFWLTVAGLTSLVAGGWGLTLASGLAGGALGGPAAVLGLLGMVPGLLVMAAFLLTWALGQTSWFGRLGPQVLPLLLSTVTVWASCQALAAPGDPN